ncbi:delta(24)-sterol reductase-like [Choristoneura fumiferana]|uniref:delta(24)-sterol reductase-like n=1 Tax=Choristoneura fumiferana TaxID=7141 RepID=UPI003D15AB15
MWLASRRLSTPGWLIKAWLSGDRSTRLCTARPTWQTMSFRQGLYKKTFTNIEVNLVDVLEVDKNNMRQSVANMVTNGPAGPARWKPLGLVPVAPSWTTESVSAWSMGTGVETCRTSTDCSSTSSTDENPDLFYAVPWSYGTLGFLASAVMKVIPAKKYVRLEYHPYTSLPELSKRFQEESLKQNPHQFVEALLYNKDQGVVMLGDMVDEIGSDGKYNPIGKWYSEWFFKQVEKHLNARQSIVEYIPLRDYYHRHTKSLFWELQDIISFGNNVIFRYLFGWLMPPEVSLLKLTQPEAVGRLYDRAHVIQDMLVPIQTLERAIQLFHDKFRVYPIWLCPFKVPNNPGQLRVSGDWQMFVDIGVYGVPKAPGFETVSFINTTSSSPSYHP